MDEPINSNVTVKKPIGEIRSDIDGGFHGAFVRDKGEGRGPRVAVPKPTDLSHIDLQSAEGRLAQQAANVLSGGSSFPIGPSGTRARKTKLAVMGLSSEILDSGDPRYAACIRLANAYRKTRTREFYIAHGYVSSGASSLLASAAMALAGARFLYEIASQTEEAGEPITRAQRADLIKSASKLSDSARQNELSAWELCAREAVVRKRNDAGSDMPWLVPGSNVIADESGVAKRPRGRPRKSPVLPEGK